MPSTDKKEKVKQIKKWFDKSDSFLVLRYRGLRVAEANEFRGLVTRNDAQARVLKNTLTRIALDGTDKEGLIPLIDGPVAIVFAGEEPVTVARLVKDFSKGREEFFLLGGMISGRVLDGKQVEAYAVLPSRQVMLGQALGSLAAPLSGLVGVAAGPIRKLLYLMKAVAETKPAEAPTPAPVEEAPAESEPEKAETPGPEGPEGVPVEDVSAETDEPEAQEGPDAAEPVIETQEEAKEAEADQAEAPEDKQES